MQHIQTFTEWVTNSVKLFWLGVGNYWRNALWHRLIMVTVAALCVFIFIAYGFAIWYRTSVADQPRVFGATFVADYARALGVNPEQTMDALIDDVGVRRFRLVSYWNKIEREQGTYDFSELDWQFKKAEDSGSKITLALGLRQPRWPECHMPDWAAKQSDAIWQPKLNNFITAVVNRYKNSPSLESYQLENEYLLRGFGTCKNFDRQRLISEYDLVKKTDPHHPVILTRSNNYVGIPVGKPKPDLYGISIYRRIWDSQFTNTYQTHPEPAWSYAALAGFQKVVTGRDMFIHEFQMEPWAPNGQFLGNTTVEEQDKSFSVSDWDNRINYAKRTGMRTIDLWGAEWWYWRKEIKKDPSFWNEAKKTYNENR